MEHNENSLWSLVIVVGEGAIYIMLKPDPALAALMDACRRMFGLDSSYPRDRLHCTLLPLWDRRLASDRLLAATCAALDAFDSEPFTLVLTRIDGLALRAGKTRDVVRCQRGLVRWLARAGVLSRDYSFTPHVSLAYRGAGVASRPITPLHWDVTNIALIESVHGEGHRELGRWPLKSRQLPLFT